jgi:hypothetical protein
MDKNAPKIQKLNRRKNCYESSYPESQNTAYRIVSPRQQTRYDVMKASVLLQILADNLLIQNGCRRRRELGR